MEDEERLRELEADIKEVLELQALKTDRNQADRIVEERRKQRDASSGSKQKVFHPGTKQTTTMHIKTHLELVRALKHRLRLGKYGLDLESVLGRLVAEQVSLLEKKLISGTRL